MGLVTAGVYPVWENQFKIGTAGLASVLPTDMKTIADLETFSPSFDDTVETWTPMDTEGWIRRLKTGKAFGITMNGKRNIGDPGNDYVAGLIFASGSGAETKFEWTLPDGTIVAVDVVVNVTGVGGDSTGADSLEFEVLSNGKPTITAG